MLNLSTQEAFLVMDCANLHKLKNLKMSENIEIIYLLRGFDCM